MNAIYRVPETGTQLERKYKKAALLRLRGYISHFLKRKLSRIR